MNIYIYIHPCITPILIHLSTYHIHPYVACHMPRKWYPAEIFIAPHGAWHLVHGKADFETGNRRRWLMFLAVFDAGGCQLPGKCVYIYIYIYRVYNRYVMICLKHTWASCMKIKYMSKMEIHRSGSLSYHNWKDVLASTVMFVYASTGHQHLGRHYSATPAWRRLSVGCRNASPAARSVKVTWPQKRRNG